MVASVSTVSNSDYYTHMTRDLAHGKEDYYSAESAGKWAGAGAAALGLTGEVQAGELARVLDWTKGKSRAYDITFSCPKSVSSLWAAGDHPTRKIIEQAHQRAVERALLHVESRLEIRRGKAGKGREPARIVAATFQHGSNRNGDPSLHMHCVISAKGVGADGQLRTLAARDFFTFQREWSAIYDAAMADELRQIGFQIEPRGVSFEVVGVPESLVEKWSSRSKEIEAELGRLGKDRSDATGREKEIATLGTRRAKQHHDPDQLDKKWRAEAVKHGLDADRVRSLMSGGPASEPGEVNTDRLLRNIARAARRRGGKARETDLRRETMLELMRVGRPPEEHDSVITDLLKSGQIEALENGMFAAHEPEPDAHPEPPMVTSALANALIAFGRSRRKKKDGEVRLDPAIVKAIADWCARIAERRAQIMVADPLPVQQRENRIPAPKTASERADQSEPVATRKVQKTVRRKAPKQIFRAKRQSLSARKAVMTSKTLTEQQLAAARTAIAHYNRRKSLLELAETLQELQAAEKQGIFGMAEGLRLDAKEMAKSLNLRNGEVNLESPSKSDISKIRRMADHEWTAHEAALMQGAIPEDIDTVIRWVDEHDRRLAEQRQQVEEQRRMVEQVEQVEEQAEQTNDMGTEPTPGW